MENTQTQRMENVCENIQKVHEPYEWALEGTLENLKRVDQYLKEKDQWGYLFGGCISKKLPRKDIDLALEYYLDDTPTHGYKTLGVDWWFLEEYRPFTAKNTNGIITKVSFSLQEYQRKEEGGIILPKNFIQVHPRSKLIKLLYPKTDLKELKGGERK